MLTLKLHIALLCCLLFCRQAMAQKEESRLAVFIKDTGFSSLQLPYGKQVAAFYAAAGYRYCWMGTENNARLQWLALAILHADSLGLLPQDYQPGIFSTPATPRFIKAFQNDSLATELRCTDTAIHFMHDVMAGNHEEPLAFNGLHYVAACDDIPRLLNSMLQTGAWKEMPAIIEPQTLAYLAVKKQLNYFLKITGTPFFRDAVVVSSRPDTGNHALVQRLYQLGCLPSDSAPTPALLKQQLQQAQQMLSVLHDGVLRSTTLEVLNMPLARRIEELSSTLNALRWLDCISKQGLAVVVNIPSASLLLYQAGRVVLESRLIVGKKSTPTPTLASTITEVVLYPYWNVPDNIARKELLPLIKRSRAYLAMNNFQVLNRQGRVVDPAGINWRAMTAAYFPYRLRQSAGCDNSLGLIKLNFYSPFDVYLHDTPWKILFGFNKRYLSHGCMRLQKAKEAARFVLGNNSVAVDTISEENCLKNQSPVRVPAGVAIPVFVVYHTAWADSAGRVGFYEDAYNRQAAASGRPMVR